jgi:hypothetical protein
LESEFDLFLWTEREGGQEVEVFGCEIRAVLSEIVNLSVCDAEVGELSDLGLKPVVGLAVEFELGGAVGEPVGNLCVSAHSSPSSGRLNAYTNVGEVLQNSTLHGKLVKICVEQRADAFGQFA